MAHSPSGERRPPSSRRTTASLLHSVGALATSLARSGGDKGGEEVNEVARVFGGAAAPRFCPHKRHTPPLISDEQLTRVWARFGPGGRRESQPRPSPCFASQRAGWAGLELVAGPILA
jgi:hypothetical protein